MGCAHGFPRAGKFKPTTNSHVNSDDEGIRVNLNENVEKAFTPSRNVIRKFILLLVESAWLLTALQLRRKVMDRIELPQFGRLLLN